MNLDFEQFLVRSPAPHRQAEVVRALYELMRSRGYANASLKDIAVAAGMTPSHVRYYFPTKAAILESLFETVVDGLLHDLGRIDESATPTARFDSLLDYFFGGEQVDRADIGVFFQIFGIAVGDPELRRTKVRWDVAMVAFFERTFAATPRANGWSAAEAAEGALALMVGLRMKVYYAEDRELSQARELCRKSLLRLAGLLPRPPRKRPARKR